MWKIISKHRQSAKKWTHIFECEKLDWRLSRLKQYSDQRGRKEGKIICTTTANACLVNHGDAGFASDDCCNSKAGGNRSFSDGGSAMLSAKSVGQSSRLTMYVGVMSISVKLAEWRSQFWTFVKFWRRVRPLLSWVSISGFDTLGGSLTDDARSLVSLLLLTSERSRMDAARSVMELNCPSGLEESKKASGESLNFRFDPPSDAPLDLASLLRALADGLALPSSDDVCLKPKQQVRNGIVVPVRSRGWKWKRLEMTASRDANAFRLWRWRDD